MTRVLVTCPPMLGLIDEFRPQFAAKSIDLEAPKVVQTMSEDELCAILPEFDGWIIGDDPASARVLEAGRSGKLSAIVKWGVGVDNVDFEAADRLGIASTNTPGVFGREVADVAMGYVIGLARQTYRIDRSIRQNNDWPKPAGISLADKVAGVVGHGDIGANVARRLLASDMNVVVFDPALEVGQHKGMEVRAWPNVADLDFLVFTAPLNPATHHMFNEQVLADVKPGLRLVNVGRGPVVKETALMAGLADGRIHSAALDVFEIEPLAAGHELRGYENCIFGSHNASNTVDAVRRVSNLAITKLFEFLNVE